MMQSEKSRRVISSHFTGHECPKSILARHLG